MDGLHLFDKPYAVWNCDEMSKNFEHSPSRVVAAKGEDCVSRTSSKSTNITVMACVNGAGRRMPPMLVVKGKTTKSLHGFNTQAAPTGSRWFYQKNGWMEDSIGEKWFNEVFLQFCGSTRPQLLILDGHSSHETLAILMRAIEENIHILAMPPHTTHYAQPLDRAVFGPLNAKYNEACSEFLQQSPLNQINKWTFPALFRFAWDNAVTSHNIQSGFKACGIVPFNPDAIPSKAYGPSEPTDVPLCQNETVASTSTATNGSSEPSHTTTGVTSPANVTLPSEPLPQSVEMSPVSQNLPTESGDAPHFQGLVSTSSPNDSFVVDVFMPQMSDGQYVASPVASPILDLADPSQLLQLLADGAVTTDLVSDESLDVSLPFNSSTILLADGAVTTDLVSQEVLDVSLPFNTSATIDKDIKDVFIPPSTPAGQVRKRQRNAITSHRLLTSEDIVNEKLTIENIKLEKEERKRAKQLKPKRVPKKVKKIKIKKEN